MTKATHAVKPGMSTVTPHLIIKDAAKAIEFYKKAFGAEELMRLAMPDGRLMHASLKIGNSTIFVCDEFPEHECGLSAASLKAAHVTMHISVEDVDKEYQRAIDAGAKALMPPQDMFWGDRYGSLLDPCGQPWSLATHKEDLTPEEMMQRMQESPCTPPEKETAKA